MTVNWRAAGEEPVSGPITSFPSDDFPFIQNDMVFNHCFRCDLKRPCPQSLYRKPAAQ